MVIISTSAVAAIIQAVSPASIFDTGAAGATISAKAGSEGRLFGSVTSADVVDAVADQAGVELDRRKLLLSDPIKSLGTHSVAVRLHPDVEFPVSWSQRWRHSRTRSPSAPST